MQNFVESGTVLILARGRIIQHSMSALRSENNEEEEKC